MNFLGHAVVASWRASDPGWLFGAMLPDFASMARARRVVPTQPRVVAGVAHHHATDAVFHSAPTFVRIHDGGTRELEARGVRRGPARAVSHIGTELLLDGFLMETPAHREAYLCALTVADLQLDVPSPDAATRLERLLDRLRAIGVPEGGRSIETVVERLDRTLGARPRLAFRDDERPEIAAWLERTARQLESQHRTLMDEVRKGLKARAETAGAHPGPRLG